MKIQYMTVVERKDRLTIDREFFGSKSDAYGWLDALASDTISAEVYEVRLIEANEYCEGQK